MGLLQPLQIFSLALESGEIETTNKMKAQVCLRSVVCTLVGVCVRATLQVKRDTNRMHEKWLVSMLQRFLENWKREEKSAWTALAAESHLKSKGHQGRLSIF